jgi:hypothetical protein
MLPSQEEQMPTGHPSLVVDPANVAHVPYLTGSPKKAARNEQSYLTMI